MLRKMLLIGIAASFLGCSVWTQLRYRPDGIHKSMCSLKIQHARRAAFHAAELRGASVALVSAGNAVELTPEQQERFLSIFDRRDSFYECQGVLGGMGEELRFRFAVGGQLSDAIFCGDCQYLLLPGVDVRLSSRGVGRIRSFAKDVL